MSHALLPLLLLAVAAPLAAQDAPQATPRYNPDAPDAPIRRDDTRKDAPWKSYDDVVKGAERRVGLFTLYRQRAQVYLALRPEQFERDYLLVTQISQGIGELGLDGGATVRSDLVRFHRAGDRVELWVVNPYVTAAPGSPMARAVAASFGSSVAYAFPVATVRDTTELLVDVAPFLVSDWADVGATLYAAAASRRMPGSASLDRDRSSLLSATIFPSNFEAEARLTFGSPRNLGIETVTDYRWIPVGVHYSLMELPATPMRARYADDRVGYFISAVKDFSRDTAGSFFVRYINRWRLEKKDPTAEVSEPLRPIVYYIDHTVPHEWRPYVRAGLLEWNRAFEEAGFRNAIEVRDAPGDSLWSAEDARYSTVRWTVTNRAIYAVGPTNVDPRTGEILNADVLISAGWIQAWRGEATQYAGAAAAVNAAFATDSILRENPSAALLCAAPAGLARQGTLVRTALAASGLAPGTAVPEEYIGAALKELVMHEVGHTLGLRHNFRGSAGVPLARLGDRDWTAVHGLGASVMDYSPAAIAGDSTEQGDIYSGTIGTYDRWAIAYGYGTFEQAGVDAKGAPTDGTWTPDYETGALAALASQAAEPGHRYASDEDAAFGGAGIDPFVTRYDQTDDPLGWARRRVALINRLFDSLETRLVAPGQSYTRLRKAFAELLTDRWYATLVATKYVGGAVTSRGHRDDPGAQPAFVPVPAAEQRTALAFLTDAAFGERAYVFRPELLNRLAPERWLHWGANPWAQDRTDFPLHEWALVQQQAILNVLLAPDVLARVRDAELRVPDGTPRLTLPELFDALTEAIWAEVPASAAAAGRRGDAIEISAMRRDAQRLYLGSLTRLVVNPAPGVPEDARAVARMELIELQRRMDRTLARADASLDAYTRAHLTDSRERIARALDAQMVQPTGTPR